MNPFLYAALAVLAILAALASSALATPALAQEAGTTVNLAPLIDEGLKLLAAVIGVVALWAVQRLARLAGVKIDETSGAILNAGIQRGVDYAVATARSQLAGRSEIEVRNEMVRLAANYVLDKLPDTVAHFRITPDRLAQMVEARLPA